jgi:tRNA A37 threonylcarbamoyladenosine synthetase subunit TsaC/SUA5/YrdC
LVGTSANLTGKPPATSAEEIVNQFGDRVDIVLDGGRSLLGVASTVVDLTGEHIVVLREGPIARADVVRCLKQRSR